MALAICVIMGAWAAAFAKAESEKSAVDAGAAFSTSSAFSTSPALGTSSALSTAAAATGTPLFQRSDLFSDRDLEQEADLTDAVTYMVADGQEVRITDAGVYVLTGSARNATVYVEADEKDKVQLVLDGLTITNDDFPAIYVKSADKVFVTTAADSSLVVSSENGVVSKDDLKITGGTYAVSARVKAMEANDSIRVADGVLQLTAGTDGLHAENDDDDGKGYIYIGGGTLTVTAGDDGIHATTVVQVDDGTLTVTAAEGIEATYVQLNGGVIAIDSWDDGVNAAQKSSAYRATVEINGGDITIAMSAGDTDGVDANGDIIVNGGTIRVTGSSTFDYDGSAQYNGGTIIANGQQIDYIPNQMMGGRGGMGGWGRGFGGRGRG